MATFMPQGGCGSHGHDHDHGGGLTVAVQGKEAGGCCGGSDHDHGYHHEEHEACDTPKTEDCDGNGGCSLPRQIQIDAQDELEIVYPQAVELPL